MTDSPVVPPSIPLVVGANHRSSSLALRDQLFVEERALPGYLDRLKDLGLTQAIVLSTCDRVEIQAAHRDPAAAATAIEAAMAAHAGLSAADLVDQIYCLEGEDAVRQVFSVAASLDSLVIGEPQVLGQVKEAHRLSVEAGMMGPELEIVLQAAYAAAKRVRSETRIGERPVSIAAAAVEVAGEVHGDLSRCRGLLIGGGDMGDMIAEGLQAAGLGHLVVVHVSDARADRIARALGCHAAPMARLGDELPSADIVLSAQGGRRHTIAPEMVAAALKARRQKPIYLVDAAVPGDIDPAVNDIDGAFLYDMDDLERVATEGRQHREAEAEGAKRILEEEIAKFLKGKAERIAAPAVTRLHQRFESAREAALKEAGGDAEKATRLLIGRLLHDPSETMRALAAEAGSEAAAEERLKAAERVLERLFRLESGKKPEDGR